jgi:hypothetical protein
MHPSSPVPSGSLGERMQYAQPLPVLDALIAATARVHGMAVVTRNVKDFELAGVQVLSPFAGHEGMSRWQPAPGHADRCLASIDLAAQLLLIWLR